MTHLGAEGPFLTASGKKQGAIGDSVQAGDLAALQLPADTWHGYVDGDEVTLCHLPLIELHLFPELSFLPPRGDPCRACLEVARRVMADMHL